MREVVEEYARAHPGFPEADIREYRDFVLRDRVRIESRRRLAAQEAKEGIMAKQESSVTLEQRLQRDEEAERQAAERERAESQARREERQRLQEDAILGGHRTSRLRAVEERLRDLHVVANWRWAPTAPLPALTEEQSAAMKEIQAGVRDAVRQVLAPRIEEAMAERQAAEAERHELIRQLRRNR